MNRHIKQFFFYILGRFFYTFRFFDKATFYYSRAIRFRFFFIDIQDRYKKSIEKNTQNNSYLINGGIGDILQYLPFVIKNKSLKYIVVSHFTEAKAFFNSLGIETFEHYFFKSPLEANLIIKKLQKRENFYHCPRAIFFDKNPFKLKKLFTRKSRKTTKIGLHVGASKLGLDKILPSALVKKIIDGILKRGFELIFFCTKEEFLSLPPMLKKSKKIEFVCHNDIIKNLSRVRECDFLIGSDSAFKTMSSMLKIPTLVILPINKINSFRDRTFLGPYIKRKIMTVYTLEGLGEKQINTAVDFVFDNLDTSLKKG